MNFFKFYELDVAFDIDAKLLKKRFLQKSRELHPDFHSQAEGDQELAIVDAAAYNNKAFHTLKDKHLRYRYILDLAGVKIEEGKETVPQDFLMEMMDLNEALMEVQFDPKPETFQNIEKDINDIKHALESELKVSICATENLNILEKSDELLVYLKQVKEHLLKVKYLDRLLGNLKKHQSPLS